MRNKRYIILALIFFILTVINGSSIIKEGLCQKPIFNKDLWNNPKIVKYNNCYSYALNRPDLTLTSKKQPAEDLYTFNKKDYTCSQFDNLLKMDNPGMYSTSKDASCGCNEYKIAMVLDNDSNTNDFHFYRQDNNSDIWSHKPGDENITQLDANKELILNPETADKQYKNHGDGKHNYNEFCSYYCLPHNDSVYNTTLKELT